MQSNFQHALIDIVMFIAVNALFMLALYYYRTSNKRFARVPLVIKQYLLQTNFLKLCVIFASFYFAIFVSYNHMGISCDKLDRDAQCQCYGLEVASHKNMKEKLHWANNGLRMCPDSKFFADFLAKNSGKDK